MTRPVGDVAVAALNHRIRAHKAALRLAEHLGWPEALADSTEQTRIHLNEAEACLLAVVTALVREAKPDASTYLQRSNQ